MKKGFTSILFLAAIAALIATAGYLVFAKKAIAPDKPIPTPLQENIATSTLETALTSTSSVSATSTTRAALLQTCPDVWYDNRMPTIIESGQPRPVTQYFIYKGERRELTEFDMAWVSANCQISPSVVY